MHRSIRILSLLLLALVASVAAAPTSAQAASSLGCADTTTGTTDLDWTADILAGTNAHRATLGLPALILDPSITKAATWKARDLGRRNYFAHDDQAPAGSGEAARSPWDRLIDCGYNQPSSSRAENIAAGQTSGAAFVTAWINSPGHRANIENASMRYIGIATARAEASTYKTYSVQMFSSKPGTTPAPAPTPPAPTPTPTPSQPTPTPPAPTPTTPVPAPTTPAPQPTTPVPAPTTTKVELPSTEATTDVCPSDDSGLAYREDSSTGPILVTSNATGCLQIDAVAPGTGTVIYRATTPEGATSTPVVLKVTVVADRSLDSLDGDATPVTPPRTIVKGAAATITKTRCRGRWSVAGWCYTLTSRATLLRPNGAAITGQSVTVTRRTLAGRSAVLGTATTSRTGVATLSTRLKPPTRGTRAWLLATVHTVQLQYRGTSTLLPASAVVTTRIR